MSNLNSDVLYLIFKQIQDDKTLRLCLLVNKTWCETVAPILWKNPWKYLKEWNGKLFLNVIISHLSEISRKKIGEHKLFKNIYKKPSLNYISYFKYLNLDEIQKVINLNIMEKSKLLIQNEIFNIFINENMRFTHLYAHKKFDNQIKFIYGSELCFSEIEYLSCSTSINDSIMSKLTEACNTIKQLELFIGMENNNCGIIELIGAQKKLLKIDLTSHTYGNELFCKNLENSLIKHANTIQYCKICRQPSTNFLASFINLKELELGCDIRVFTSWNFLGSLSFPFLQILKSSGVPIEALIRLIKNTRGSLIEIKIDRVRHDKISNKRLIQVIYQKCPNIKYLKLLIRNSNILELEPLLINCKHLDGLFILISHVQDRTFLWPKLFDILSKSSSSSLFKFKFNSNRLPQMKTFKLFFDNWKGRNPMFLQILSYDAIIDLGIIIERYKSEGIIEKFEYNCQNHKIEDFEWN
ncbi:hypothetical protein RhiirB3_525604 [Rhizophagus irregularis]|nr:hypothetical protein RhiirB3_525604 [Rhizophagus irregularis]